MQAFLKLNLILFMFVVFFWGLGTLMSDGHSPYDRAQAVSGILAAVLVFHQTSEEELQRQEKEKQEKVNSAP